MLFHFLLQVCGLTLSIADLENSFCQSNSLDRSAGPLYVESCEGSKLATWIAHSTRHSSVRPQRRTTTMASLGSSSKDTGNPCWNRACTHTSPLVEVSTD